VINVEALVYQVAYDVRRRFRSYVDSDDLISEGWMWVYEHPKAVEDYQMDSNRRRAIYRMRRDISIHVEKFARKEKAQRLGYDPSDEQFYNAAIISVFLPQVVAGDYEMGRTGSEVGQTNADPAESGTWMAARADVSRAWGAANFTDLERSTMLRFYVEGYSAIEIGQQDGVERQSVDERLKKGVAKMTRHLGGTKPKGCPFDCECHEGRLRARPGIHSNLSGMNQELD
jgi:RNA polymerase sigma factor (sigma-70 family)